MLDDQEIQTHEEIQPRSLVFSPNCLHLAYLVNLAGTSRVAVDGLEGLSAYDSIPRGAKPAFDSNTTFHTIALRDQKLLRVRVQIVAN